MELLSRVHDHVIHKFVKGFSLLTLGWSDGYSFVPLDFALLSSSKKENRFSEIDSSIDKRTSGYKPRLEAMKSKLEVLSNLIHYALEKLMNADYVFMDIFVYSCPVNGINY